MQSIPTDETENRTARPRIRSLESKEPAIIDVRNRTQRKVEVLWINYDSRLVRYRTLDPGALYRIHTFKTHPWVFREYETGLLMHVNHRDILWPDAATPERPAQAVHIHFPLFSMKTVALWKVVENIQRISDIDQLELPSSILAELRQIYRQYYIRRFIVSNGIDARSAQSIQAAHRVNFLVPVSWFDNVRSANAKSVDHSR